MKRRPTTLAESELQKKLLDISKNVVDNQEYRAKRREVKKEMKELDRKMLKQAERRALKEYFEKN